MAENDPRSRLLAEAQKLKGVRFPRKEEGERSGILQLEDSGSGIPKTLSCSQFVRCVVDRAFGRDFWLKLVNHDYEAVADGGARAMCSLLQEIDEPEPGDLRFFGSDEADDWHVMMVASVATLIGAVPGDEVREVAADHFAGMKDQGARRMPVPKEPDELSDDAAWSPDFGPSTGKVTRT